VRGGWTRTTARSDRWKRENDAPRLKDEVPGVLKLQLELEELQEDRPIAGTRRVRHFVLANASARFEIPCGEEKCEGGGHDVSHEVLSRLRAREPAFSGRNNCGGMVKDRGCDRTLRYAALAEYEA
jgi:hypothetical protein